MTRESRYGQVDSVFGMDNVGCAGTETNLTDCAYNPTDDCRGEEGAGVVCDTRTQTEIEEERQMIENCFEDGVSYHYGEYIDFAVVDRLAHITHHT